MVSFTAGPLDVHINTMFTHTPQSTPKSWNHASRTDQSREFSSLYFSFSSNMSPKTMKGRFPSSLFCGLAVLKDWKFTINTLRYANIEPSQGDVVYGALYFISPREESDLDEDGGVPHLYTRQTLEVTRVDGEGSEMDQVVPALVYVDVERRDRGEIMPEYVVWIRKAVRDAKAVGLPHDYAEKYIEPWLPQGSGEETADNDAEMEPVRFIFNQGQFQ